MVQLTLTPRLTSALKAYNSLPTTAPTSQIPLTTTSLSHTQIRTISHALLTSTTDISKRSEYKFSTLLKGAEVYIPPKPAKKEPTAEFKALMERLRREEEEREYARMVAEGEKAGLEVKVSAGASWDDEMTLREIKDQISVIFNVIFSVFATAAAVWMVAWSWEVTARLGLAFTAALVVLIAEVVIYNGYLRRVELAKEKERKKPERKKVVETLM